jgi:hypothetical protein
MAEIALDLETFRSSVLKAWSGDESSAFAAASESMWLAVIVHCDAKKATVACTVPDTGAAKQVMGYIDNFIKDHEALAQIPTKAVPDGVMLGKVRVLVLPRGSSRRPQGVVATAEMAGADETREPTQLPDDEELARRIAHVMLVAESPSPSPELSALREKIFNLIPGARAIFAKPRRVEGDEQQWAAWRAAQRITSHAGSSLEDLPQDAFRTPITTQRAPSREAFIASPEFEQQRLESMGRDDLARDARNQPVLTGPRGTKWRGH